jgi:hypothetical protein
MMRRATLGFGREPGTANTVAAPSTRDEPSLYDPKPDAINALKLTFTWSKEGFGNVMQANFTITNKGTRDVKDLEITCTHFAKSGTQIDRNTRTIYDVVKAGKTRTFRNFNMGFIHSQADKSRCEVVDLAVE